MLKECILISYSRYQDVAQQVTTEVRFKSALTSDSLQKHLDSPRRGKDTLILGALVWPLHKEVRGGST